MTAFLKTERKRDVATDYYYWSDWKQQWTEARVLQVHMGLLHSGFATVVESAEEESERLRFYLKTADGHCTPQRMLFAEGQYAKKAFAMLADQFDRDFLWSRLPSLSPAAAGAVLRFFRPKKEYEESGLVNLRSVTDDDKSRDHASRKVRDAFLKFCLRVWEDDYSKPYGDPVGPWPKNLETISLLNKVRPRILGLLHAYGNGQLEKLIEAKVTVDKGVDHLGFRVRWELFDPPCLSRLEKLATLKLDLPRDATIQEALVAGCAAAKVLIVVRAAQEQLAQKK